MFVYRPREIFHPSVCLSIRSSIPPPPEGQRASQAALGARQAGLRGSQAGLRASQPGLRASQPGLRASQPGLRGSEACLAGSEASLAGSKACLAGSWALEGGMYGHMDVQTYGRKISPFYKTLSKKMIRKTLFLGCMLGCFGALMAPDGNYAYPR